MNLELSGRKFLVTASSRGLGYSVAQELLREGALVMLSSSNAANLAKACDRLKAEGLTGYSSFVADITQADEIDALLAESYRTLGRLDGLVTNCGGPPAGAPLAIRDEQWEKAFESVFMSVVRLCRGTVPRMIEQGGGSILAITSSSVKQPIANLTTSNSLRPGLTGFLRYLAVEVAPNNVRVNTVAPGRFLTERTLELDRALAARTGKSEAEVRAESEAEIPLGRLGDISEFPALCAFLLSPKASYLTGQTICIDGGRVQSVW